MRLKPEQIPQIGFLLYGHSWRKGMARDMGVSYRSITRWTHEGVKLKEHYIERLTTTCKRRINDIDQIRVMLELR
jgi:hypothetical protein